MILKQDYPKETDMKSFLEEDIAPASKEDAQFHVIPAPFEESVSYGTGTAKAPEAILDASQQLELFDGISSDAIESGIYTAPAIENCGTPETVLKSISNKVESTLKMNKIPVVLGGEHTVTLGAVDALLAQGVKFGVVQFDAHADLRETYEGSPYSHACVMKRIFDRKVPFYQVGVRALCKEEYEFRKAEGIPHLDAREIYGPEKKPFVIPDSIPQKVFVTIDIDGLDPSVVSATGTPVPGGIQWYDMLAFLQTIVAEREVVGFDCVELAPQKGNIASTFAATQLIYNFMGMIARER